MQSTSGSDIDYYNTNRLPGIQPLVARPEMSERATLIIIGQQGIRSSFVPLPVLGHLSLTLYCI